MRRLLPLALFAFAAGCGATITTDDGSNDCGPEPESEGYCPPAWQCIDGEWVDTSGACPEPACPVDEPSYGDRCDLIGQTCEYTVDVPCGPYGTDTATCTADGWMVYTDFCEPPPECPPLMPVVGTDCSGWDYAYYCSYPVSCDAAVSYVGISCGYDSGVPLWRVDSPATCSDCFSIGDAASCSAATSCKWLTPGCDSNSPPITEGCFPAADCNVEGCSDPSATCSTYSYNPCPDGGCDACAAPIGVCELLLD
jgi:hypothetical protein